MFEAIANQLVEMFFYFYIGGAIFYIFGALLMLLSFPLSYEWGVRVWMTRFARFLLVLGIAFIWGVCLNGVWHGFFNGRLYVLGDPLFDFHPFLPFGWWSLDKSCGGHLQPGVEMWQLRILWLGSAIVVWTTAIFTLRFLQHHRLTSR